MNNFTRDKKSEIALNFVQKMTVPDFINMLECLMRVSWAAAAGRLSLATTVQTVREYGSRGRQSSTSSTASSGSDADITNLRAGVCFRQPGLDLQINDSIFFNGRLNCIYRYFNE